jgi:hypothetical protein
MRALSVLVMVTWWLFGIIAAVWWLPAYFDEPRPIPWQFGALCILMQWALVLNRWPALGTRRFFNGGQPFLKLQLAVVTVLTLLFLFGVSILVHRGNLPSW